MNRQAIAFLTMFSLVLMLAVYYITMPIVPLENETPVVGTPNSLLEMKQQLDTKRQLQLDSYTEVIASKESSSQDKTLAIEQMNSLQQVIKAESNYQNLLKDAGYDQCHIELESDVMKILVIKEDYQTEDASKIIKLVLTTSNYQYIPEVIFTK